MKKWMSWMLVCALLCSLAAVPAAAADETAAASAETEETVSVTFEDVQGLACQEAVEALASMGIVGGYPDGTFRPGADHQPRRGGQNGCYCTRLQRRRDWPCTPAR